MLAAGIIGYIRVRGKPAEGGGRRCEVVWRSFIGVMMGVFWGVLSTLAGFVGSSGWDGCEVRDNVSGGGFLVKMKTTSL